MTGIWTFLCPPRRLFTFFFFNDTATTEIYTLSLHDALPISALADLGRCSPANAATSMSCSVRSEEHTSELQSPKDLVCRLLLEKKNNTDGGGLSTGFGAPTPRRKRGFTDA